MPPEGVNIFDLKPAVEPLLRCATSHDSEDKYHLKVHRRAIKEDTLNQLKWGLPIDKHLRVVFLGESAVDTGGPLQDFMHMLISSIACNNSLFTGDETHHVPAHNVMEVEKNTYYFVGVSVSCQISTSTNFNQWFAR